MASNRTKQVPVGLSDQSALWKRSPIKTLPPNIRKVVVDDLIDASTSFTKRQNFIDPSPIKENILRIEANSMFDDDNYHSDGYVRFGQNDTGSKSPVVKKHEAIGVGYDGKSNSPHKSSPQNNLKHSIDKALLLPQECKNVAEISNHQSVLATSVPVNKLPLSQFSQPPVALSSPKDLMLRHSDLLHNLKYLVGVGANDDLDENERSAQEELLTQTLSKLLQTDPESLFKFTISRHQQFIADGLFDASISLN